MRNTNQIEILKAICVGLEKAFNEMQSVAREIDDLCIGKSSIDGQMSSSEHIRYTADSILRDMNELGLLLSKYKKETTNVMSIDSDR